MEYRVLGRTGIKVSAIGIGGEGFENRSFKITAVYLQMRRSPHSADIACIVDIVHRVQKK